MSNDNTTKYFPEMPPPILSELIEDQKRFNAGDDGDKWKDFDKFHDIVTGNINAYLGRKIV